MKAFILAAGFGRRIGTHTQALPKPLLRVGTHPLIYYTLYQLHKWHIEEIIINTHYLAEKIVNALKSYRGAKLFFSHEDKMLGTAGAIKNQVGKRLSETEDILLINPDAIFLSNDSNDIPLSLPHSLVSMLYMEKLTSQQNERTWSLTDSHYGYYHAKPNNGDYLYLGYSIVNTLIVKEVAKNEVVELGPLWRQAASNNLLGVKKFQGTFIPVGNKSQYENLCNKNIIPPSEKDSWIDFLKKYF